MLKLIAPLGATLLLGSASAATAPAVDGPDGAIRIVICGDRAGTAFRVGPVRWMTAAHVTSHEACVIDGDPVETVREDGALDIAELRSAAPGPFLQLNCRGFRRGRLYRAIGYAGGQLRMNLPWQATGFGDAPGKAEFLGEVYPGMSGGPVLDRDGRVAGVTQQRFPARARELASTWVCEAAR